MDGNYLIVKCIVYDQGNVIECHALRNCGATGYTFIDGDYARHHHLPLHLLKSPRNLRIIDRSPVTSGAITHITCTCLTIQNHQEDISLFVTKLGHYPIYLGIPWL
jgi:hypothetical protein